MEGINNSELVRRLLEIPVIREINNVLRNTTRPVDWKLAGQISQAVAGSGIQSVRPTKADVEEFAQDCRIAELAVVGQSGLGPVRGITDVRLLTRPQWTELNVNALKPLVERLASRLSASASPDTPSPVQPVMDAIGPLVMGAQFGLTFGYLSHKALGTWDFGLPREATRSVKGQVGQLNFNFSNIVRLEEELEIDPRQFRMWLALHDVTHELLFQAVGWAGPYFNSLVENYIDAAQVDASELVAKVQSFSDPQQLASLLQRPEDLLPLLRSPIQQSVAEKIECFLSLTEGYSDWILKRGGLSLVQSFDRIREGMSRRTAERSSPERMLEKLFGLDLSNRNRRAGERFVGAIAGAGRLEVLWTKVENLPSVEELSQPERWISRVGVA